jgi:glutathione peroxidase
MGVHQFTLNTIDGKPKSLADYKGHVLLLVNVASECGHTPQYKGLEALYEKYREQGLRVLGFPANNFGGQEPGSEAEIKRFCEDNYGVSFDLFAKLEADGEQISPLYKYLTTQAGFDGPIPWNFTKFLADREGKIIARFHYRVKPEDPELIGAIEKALKA